MQFAYNNAVITNNAMKTITSLVIYTGIYKSDYLTNESI